MGKHTSSPECAIAFTWCYDCGCVHVGLFREDGALLGMGAVPDLDGLIAALQQIKSEHYERPHRLQ
jgi:hypothetical protein